MPDTPLSLEGPYEGGPDAKALGPDLYVRPNSRLAAGPPRASCCTSLCLVPLLVNGNNNSVKPKGRAWHLPSAVLIPYYAKLGPREMKPPAGGSPSGYGRGCGGA